MYADDTLIIDSMMYRLAGDIYIFVPAFLNVADDPDTFIYYAMKAVYVVEFIAMALSLPTTLLHNYCLSRTTVFHPNVARIAQVWRCLGCS
ncbi:unnamed protein product [Heligmosomoides polygyrus]|uniref:G_PROTEIN_RECEP_F1_2 domain-containing protein n=1 Tax=Heligmosomoides polygyrus TaxID=6339 RepID=A0A183GUS0_HELPZ|nr:unnamed protein product [Heligmosomoides polygyrus]